MKSKSKPELSIVILNYNTRDFLNDCLESLGKRKLESNFEVIVSDNDSSDGSVEMVRGDFSWVKLVLNKRNLGFAAGNNRAKSYCKGRYVLFLNSDTLVPKGTIKQVIKYISENGDVGALTCKILLPSGDLDKDARRSFVTPWIGLVHIFLKLDRVFPKSRVFGKYWYGYISADKTHEVDALQGAFFLVRRKLLDEVGWFDEDYFLDGEDIDLSWRIKEKGWKIMYYPLVYITHFKGVTKGKNKRRKKDIRLREKMKYRMSGVNSMEIFVRKRLWNKYPYPVMLVVYLGIKILRLIRVINLIIFG